MSLVEQSSLGVGYLDSQAFSLSLGDLDGVELAALDLVQNGLAGASELLGGLVQRHVFVGNVGHEPGADLVGEADAPGRVRGGLLAWEQACFEPAVDRAVGHAELLAGLGDRV